MNFDTRQENEQEPETLKAAKSPTPNHDISTHSRQDHRAGAGEGKGREGKGSEEDPIRNVAFNETTARSKHLKL
ncbi:hypothetical protein [Agrobacterium vitis]|uniref:hypothetical protein n=1 Tax=Agrobacterium vitis TaxID=373 RepID=UPI0008DC182C|nr:hypothetical protein [Agrobacterium vitis]MUO84964.1 hypothetical protein [Agrobacterium vitis]